MHFSSNTSTSVLIQRSLYLHCIPDCSSAYELNKNNLQFIRFSHSSRTDIPSSQHRRRVIRHVAVEELFPSHHTELFPHRLLSYNVFGHESRFRIFLERREVMQKR